MHEITVPKLNNNDEAYILTEWLVDDGAQVTADSPIVVVETSKASEELVAEHDGVLQHAAKVSEECGIGAVIGRIFATERDRLAHLAAAETPSAEESRHQTQDRGSTGTVITNSARAAADEHGIDVLDLSTLGKAVVKRSDVEELAAARRVGSRDGAAGEVLRLPPAQRAIGKVVTRSHESVPAAFVVVKVPVDEALKLRGERAEQSAFAGGLPELLLKAIAALRGRFPLMFARPAGDGTARLEDGANIGVTLDVGKGMYIPVLKGAQSLTLSQLADTLMDFRISALRGEFAEHELTGGNIAVSLHTDEDVVLARPIIHPDHACMFCLCGVQEELHLVDGAPMIRRYVNLGLNYDHRLINGRDATVFLQEVKAILASRAELQKLVG